MFAFRVDRTSSDVESLAGRSDIVGRRRCRGQPQPRPGRAGRRDKSDAGLSNAVELQFQTRRTVARLRFVLFMPQVPFRVRPMLNRRRQGPCLPSDDVRLGRDLGGPSVLFAHATG